MEPENAEDLAKLTGDGMDAEYRKQKLKTLEPLNEQGPSCAIMEPLDGEHVNLIPSSDGQRNIRVRGYGLGSHGTWSPADDYAA